MSAIHENSRVTLHFSLKLESGDIVDSTFGKSPAELTMGDGNLPEGFEKHLLGMSAGDHRIVRVPPEEAFGQSNPGNVQSFNRAQFAQAGDLEPGVVLSFEDASGSELPGVVKEISDDRVTVDFNHPLAGKSLDFEVEILAVEAASHGH